MVGGAGWPRVERLDGPTLVAQIGAMTGQRLTYHGPCAGGEVGAAYVCLPDGEPGVLSWQPDVPVERVRRISSMLDAARAVGLPVPEYRLVVELPGAVAVVQQRMPGVVPERLDMPLLEAMIAVNRRMAHLLADRDELPAVELYLTGDGPGFCLHQPMAVHSRRTARLLDWVEQVGRAAPATMDGGDLVHLDFHHGNVLVDRGEICGIIDWDGAGCGDRRFDLVTLRFAIPADRPDLAARLDAEIDETLCRDELRPYWAHMALRQVDWAIRHYGAELIDHNLTIAESRVD